MRILVVVAACIFFCSCSRPTGSVPPTNARLVIGLVGDIQSLNPLLISGEDTLRVCPMVFSFLVTEDKDGALQPDVAEVVPSRANGGISADGKTIVYHLRPHVRWQDGVPLTASDVVYTYEQVMNPKNDVQSRAVYDRLVSVTAPDTQTVRVTLRAPDAAVLSYFFAPDGNYAILPQHILAKYPDLNHIPFNSAPVGSGPYRVVRWTRNDSLQFERNDGYFAGKPSIKEIEFKFIPSTETQLIEMRTGEIQAVLPAPDITMIDAYRRMKGPRVERMEIQGGALLGFNMDDPVVADLRMRRAILEAADLPRSVSEATHGILSMDRAGRGLYGPAFDPSIVAAPSYNVEEAERLLDDAGWKRGRDGIREKNGRPLSLSFVYLTGLPQAQTFGVVLQQQLRRAGIDLVLRGFTPQMYAAPASAGGPLFGGHFQMVFLELITSTDPDTSYFLGCNQMPPHGANFTRYCNPHVDRANALGLQTYNFAERAKESAVVQAQVAKDLPFVPLWQQATIAAYPQNLVGVHPSAEVLFYNVAHWYFR
jgi:peptide/nickel transport system substrate-binding protein